MEKSEWERGERTSQDRSGRREERRGERNRQIEKERERGEMGGRQGTSKEQCSECAQYSHRCLTEFPLSMKK